MADVEARPRVYAVGELLAGLRELLETRVGRLWVVGEVSNLRRPGSGHYYFTLKDDDGQMRAALFAGTARRLAFEPEDGLEVLVYGEVTVYGPRGDLQLIVRQLEPRGAGALQVAFDQLRRRLEAEGLFDPERKRPLPEWPTRIGVVTSGSGAAWRDVVAVSGRRQPGLPLLIAPTRVQGQGAEHEIAAALDALGRHGDVSLVLLVRGGGSLEDLQAFNSEVVARAIRRCPVPVVCGVGHETDVTIADLAADLRAPTPSAAAEEAVPDVRELAALFDGATRRLRVAIERDLASRAAGLAQQSRALRSLAPSARVAARRDRVEAIRRGLARAALGTLVNARARLGAAAARLDSLSPLAVLGRGYAIARRQPDGAIVRGADDVAVGDVLDLRVAGAELETRVEAVRPRPPR